MCCKQLHSELCEEVQLEESAQPCRLPLCNGYTTIELQNMCAAQCLKDTNLIEQLQQKFLLQPVRLSHVLNKHVK